MFEKYDAYKDSGVEWLGQVPTHWHVTRMKNLFRLVMDFAPKNNNEELLSVYTDIGVKPRKELEERGNKASTTDGYLFVQKGDIVVNKLLAWMGAIGLSEYNGVTSPAYDILRPKVPMIGKFYHNMFRMPVFSSELKKHSRGIMDMRLRLYFDKFGDVLVPSPPFEKQTAIIQFLDQKTAEIDQAIAIKEQQIALLNERKQIVIQKAVTQGLDSNVPMKDSGVEWIGQIPEHWNIHKLSYVAKLDSGSTPDRSNMRFWTNGTIPWLKTGEINYNLITQSEEFVTPLALSKSALKLAPKGTVLMAMYGQGITRGRVAILDIDATYNQACCAIQCKKGLFNKYLFQFFSFAYSFIRDGGNETSQMNISTGYISNLKVLVPPLNEQEQIVSYLDLELQKFSDLKALLKLEIEKLREYKTTLINDAVTGKIKVA